MRSLALAAVGIAGIALPLSVHAQERWASPFVTDTQSYGSEICGRSDRSRDFCFLVACNNDGDTFFGLRVTGASMTPGDRPRAYLRVNGEERFWFETFVDDKGISVLSKPSDADAEVLKGELRRGRDASIEVETDVGRERFSFTLAGSSAAIAKTEASCPVPPPPAVSDPVAEARRELNGECEGLGPLGVSDDFVRTTDFDSDGIEDMILNYGAISCGTYGAMYCGSAGCSQTLWRGTGEGTYTAIWGGHVYNVVPAGQGRVTLELHGSACGKTGASECRKTFRVGTGELVPE